MAGISLAQAQAALDAAMTAHAALLTGGTHYRIGDRMIQCPPLVEIEASIRTWRGEVERLSAGITNSGPVIYGVSLGG